MELPRIVVAGDRITDQVGELIGGLELGREALVLSGPNVKEEVGSRLSESLADGGFKAEWELVGPSTFEEVERVSKLSQDRRVHFLIGVGGGKSIDIAKLAAFNSKIPFVSIPTSASHDGISSPFGSVKGLNRPYSIVAKPPIAIIADTEIIARAPFKLMISGCGDLVAKLTAVRDWELSHIKTGEYYGRYSANLALLSADLVIQDANIISSKNTESVRVVVEALISSGVAAGIAGSSRPCSGSEHLFSHAMEIVAPGKGLHGERCGIGTIMMAKLHGMDYLSLRRSLKVIGLPTKASEIGASSDEIVKALVEAKDLRKERYTILDEAKLTEESARALAKDTGVIS
jgi:glycerol-1-phosphate dehydrogenase [NAD(P)+]